MRFWEKYFVTSLVNRPSSSENQSKNVLCLQLTICDKEKCKSNRRKTWFRNKTKYVAINRYSRPNPCSQISALKSHLNRWSIDKVSSSIAQLTRITVSLIEIYRPAPATTIEHELTNIRLYTCGLQTCSRLFRDSIILNQPHPIPCEINGLNKCALRVGWPRKSRTN